MAKYPTTKTLKKAVPTIRLDDNVVKKWDIEVIYKHTANNGTSWSRAYPHTEDVEYMNKTASEFTKAQLISFMNNMDVIFDAHYEAHNLPPKDERVNNFNINDLQ